MFRRIRVNERAYSSRNARLTPACPKRQTPKSLAGSPHTSRAEWFIREVTRVLAGERCRVGGVDGVGGDVPSGRGDDGRSSRQLLAQPHWRHPPISRSVARPAPVSAVSSTTARSG